MRRLANPAPSTHCTGDPDGRMDGRKKRKTDDPLSPRLPARWPSRQGPARRRHPLRPPRGGLCGFCGPLTRGGLGSGILRSRRRRGPGGRGHVGGDGRCSPHPGFLARPPSLPRGSSWTRVSVCGCLRVTRGAGGGCLSRVS